MRSSDSLRVIAHTDYLIDVAERRSRGENRVMERRHLPVLESGGVDLICDHVGGDTDMFQTFPLNKILTHSGPLERSLSGLDCMLQEADESKEKISIVKSFDDVERIAKNGQRGIILCLQGGSPIGEDLSLLRVFHRLGIRCMNLTANRRNALGDSCIGRTRTGLTEFGISVVKEMNRLGMVIDIAQLSPEGCQEVLNLSSQPVIASNSNARSLCDHPRNIDDNVIKLMGSNGGVVCIHCLPSFLVSEGSASVDDMIRHIRYIADLVGVEHVGIGPDLLENWPEDRYTAIQKNDQKLAGKPIAYNYPKGFESIADMPNLATKLSDAGFSNEEKKKILGGNLLRVFREVWK